MKLPAWPDFEKKIQHQTFSPSPPFTFPVDNVSLDLTQVDELARKTSSSSPNSHSSPNMWLNTWRHHFMEWDISCVAIASDTTLSCVNTAMLTCDIDIGILSIHPSISFRYWIESGDIMDLLKFIVTTTYFSLLLLLSASLYVSKRGAYWDRLCRDVVGRWLVGWLVVGCHARARWPNGAS